MCQCRGHGLPSVQTVMALCTVHKLSEDCILSRETQATASVKAKVLAITGSLPSKSRHALLELLTFPPQNNCFLSSSLLPTTRLKSSLDTGASSTEKSTASRRNCFPWDVFPGYCEGSPLRTQVIKSTKTGARQELRHGAQVAGWRRGARNSVNMVLIQNSQKPSK